MSLCSGRTAVRLGFCSGQWKQTRLDINYRGRCYGYQDESEVYRRTIGLQPDWSHRIPDQMRLVH